MGKGVVDEVEDVEAVVCDVVYDAACVVADDDDVDGGVEDAVDAAGMPAVVIDANAQRRRC